MAEFTKEQLIEKLERRLAVTTHYPDFEEAQLDAQIFKIALEALTAGMEQEPVAWLLSGGGAKNNVSFDSGNAYADPLREVTPLYTAPPAPVSVPAAMEIDDDFDSAFEHGKAVGWNAYRAAMLHGADGTLTNEDTKRVGELVMWIKRLAHSLRKSNPDSKLQSDAMDYLSRKGLIGVKDILR